MKLKCLIWRHNYQKWYNPNTGFMDMFCEYCSHTIEAFAPRKG